MAELSIVTFSLVPAAGVGLMRTIRHTLKGQIEVDVDTRAGYGFVTRSCFIHPYKLTTLYFPFALGPEHLT